MAHCCAKVLVGDGTTVVWCANVSQEDFELFADSSDPFNCPACTAKKQSTIIQQLQSAIQSLNTGALELKAGVTALQSSSVGDLQGASIGDTETHEEEGRAMQRKHHQFVKPLSCHGMLLLGGRIDTVMGEAPPTPLHLQRVVMSHL